MIDARVQDAIKQHIQKMDWLHGEGVQELQVKPPSPKLATPGGIDGKMGFILPASEAPLAQEVIAPVVNVIQEVVPLTDAPLAHEVIAAVDVHKENIIEQEVAPPTLTTVDLSEESKSAPVVDNLSQENIIAQEVAPPTLTTVDLTEESKSFSTPPVNQIAEDGVKADNVGEPAAASTPSEKENEAKTVTPPKDGTPV